MKNPFFRGVCTALITPFHDGAVDFAAWEYQLARQQEAGIRAVVVCGTTGESAALSDEEKIALVSAAVRFSGEKMTVLAGTGSNDTAHAVRLSKQAEQAGADGLLVVTPYYNKATPEGLKRHFAAVCEAVSCPVVAYNVPSRTGCDLTPDICKAMMQYPNFAGIKEASGSVLRAEKLRAVCGNALRIWSGCDELTVPLMAVGAQGVISVLSNLCPERTRVMTEAALAGAFDIAGQMQCALLPLIEALFCEVNPIPVKTAMSILGLDRGEFRLPLCPMEEANLARLKKAMTDAAIL